MGNNQLKTYIFTNILKEKQKQKNYRPTLPKKNYDHYPEKLFFAPHLSIYNQEEKINTVLCISMSAPAAQTFG